MKKQSVRPDINHYAVIDKASEITGCETISRNVNYPACYNMYSSLESFILDIKSYVLFINLGDKNGGRILHVVNGCIMTVFSDFVI
jgi:hypothetical protein